MKKFLLFILGGLLATNLQAQVKCYAHEHMVKQLANDPSFVANQAKLEAEAQKADLIGDKKTRVLVTIPVVVHILHNGQAVGNGPNLSVAQIESQIEALNEDFRKKNSDSLVSGHPFKSVSADVDIEFCLANATPNGATSTGILRYNIGQSSYSIDDMENTIKPQTIWNRDQYLNFWVGNLVDPSVGGTILGFAQFPGGVANTDGVAILYNAFGYTGNVQSPSDNGRTAVHEVGHWLNLRHIWGDAFCGSDGVTDTPPAEDKNSGCPTFPHNAFNSCGTGQNGEMFMNYMDYCTDKCMVMFTQGQKTRMQSAINGARASLKNSLGCNKGKPVSVTEIKSGDALIEIFPNPVTQDFCSVRLLRSMDNYTIRLVNIQGQEVLSIANPKSTSDYVQVDMRNLPAGLYYLQLNTAGVTVTKKVIKQ
jgi:Pregnancy-associated plasma protein-A/Secretion system C-terminal sorting domain